MVSATRLANMYALEELAVPGMAARVSDMLVRRVAAAVSLDTAFPFAFNISESGSWAMFVDSCECACVVETGG